MSIARLYEERFGYRSGETPIEDTLSNVQIAHSAICNLADIMIDAKKEAHYGDDHIYALCRAQTAILAMLGAELDAAASLAAKLRFEGRQAERPAPAEPSDKAGADRQRNGGGLSAVVDRIQRPAPSGLASPPVDRVGAST